MMGEKVKGRVKKCFVKKVGNSELLYFDKRSKLKTSLFLPMFSKGRGNF